MRSLNPGSAVLAGLAGTAVMTILMYAGPLIGLPSMDIMGALGSLVPGAPTYLVGGLVHFGIGVTLALLYALLFAGRLPGPGWFRGALFSLLPWLFAITLMAPTMAALQSVLQPEAQAGLAANPCAARPANPCAAPQPATRLTPGNPSALPANPCASAPVAMNPCAVGAAPGRAAAGPAGPGPWTVRLMSLASHLVFGAVVGTLYRWREQPTGEEVSCGC